MRASGAWLTLGGLLAGLLGACGAAPPSLPKGEYDGEVSYDAAMAMVSGGAKAGPQKPALAPTHSLPIQPSKLADDVKALGLDMAKLPKLAAMDLGQKKKLMPLFQRALGYDSCQGCHAEGDLKKRTRNVEIATKMWDELVVKLEHDKQKGPVFCDSCHQGSPKTLARGDKEAVAKFMDDDYVMKLARRDGQEISCATCHGDLMENKIIEKLWGIR
jgi:hypothetical protein